MKCFLLSLYLLLSFPSHDIQVAYFKVSENADGLQLNINFETNDLCEQLQIKTSALDHPTIETYLKKNLKLRINGLPCKIIMDSFLPKPQHIEIQCRLKADNYDEIKTIIINNTCMLSIADYSNVIDLFINDQERSFLMNKERTTVTVTY